MVLLQSRRIPYFSSSKSSPDFFAQGFVVPKFIEERLMEEVLNVLAVVESGRLSGGFGCLLLITWFSRVNPYKGISITPL